MRRKVYICAPLEGDLLECLSRFQDYAKYVLNEGASPVAVHFYLLCYQNQNPASFHASIEQRMSLLWYCDEIWVFGSWHTDIMKQEITFCENINLKVRYVSDNEVKKSIGG